MSSLILKTIDDAAKALVFTKFRTPMELSATQNINIVQEPREVSLRKISEKRGQDSVEFISLWRDSIEFDWARQNSVAGRKGIPVSYTDGTKSSATVVKAVPVKMNYSVRFWSTDYDKVQAAVEEFLFWRHSNPNLIFNYTGLYPLELDILPGNVVDESEYANQYTKGLYFVSRCDFTLDGWVLSSLTWKTILQVTLNLYLREIVNNQNVDTLIGTYITESNTSSGS